MKKKPLILISNDDGITSKGIRTLVEIMSTIGEVVVVAPNSPQSGMGHAITINDPLKIYKSDIFDDIEAYECSGTPADCIKVAKNYILKDREPDLVVSGINHGSNTSVSVLYSGTMSAAIEAAIEGLPSIGFSLCDYDARADFSHIEKWVKEIAKEALEKGIGKGVALNVNFPKKSETPVKGVKICRQAIAKWVEEFDERTDPSGRKYLWLSGYLQNNDKGEDTDEWAIKNNFASVVPVLYDMTAHLNIAFLNDEWDL
ncbi:5'/3'-nucleotidase SurE [Flexithrix dorotheae]|uniref:5'/3'-nucleotidase SurE n=1 Tax=Flexithrix dorotheae TaxID=70993 RepID=UPI00037C3126|nr:5'/3'-nucleotidase SurE [Flexithrix dorotheae]